MKKIVIIITYAVIWAMMSYMAGLSVGRIIHHVARDEWHIAIFPIFFLLVVVGFMALIVSSLINYDQGE